MQGYPNAQLPLSRRCLVLGAESLDFQRRRWSASPWGERLPAPSSATVAKPVAVRYGWADCPVVKLWNKNGLPASPFRTRDFPMITAAKK
jgi:hypothetical protein